jgi:DNA-binding LacI/PurR family transcriptional regulator
MPLSDRVYERLQVMVRKLLDAGQGGMLPPERELAEQCGVSRPTVRKALARLEAEGWAECRPAVGYLVRQRVEMRPATQPKALIGLVVNYTSDPLPIGTRILERELSDAGYSILLGFNDTEVERENACLARFLELGCAGVVIIPAVHGAAESRLGDLIRGGFPVVALGEPRGWRISRELYDAVGCVDVDNAAVTGCTLAHLVELGHRRIGMVKGADLHGVMTIRERTYRNWMREQELPFSEDWIIGADALAAHSGEDQLRQVCADAATRPTAFFATADALARHTIHALREIGLHVPRDVSVVGVGPLESGETRLTRVTYSAKEYAREVVRQLMTRIQGQTLRQRTLLLPEWQPGATAAVCSAPSTKPGAQRAG